MKKRNIKLMSFLFIGLFTIMVSTGCSCSCTSSMCSEQDEKNIKAELEKKHIEEWRNTAALSGTKVESDEYIAYANAKVEALYLTSECGISGTCSAEEIVAAKNLIRNQNNNKWLNELEALSESDSNFINTRTDSFQKFVDEKVEELYKTHAKACLVLNDDIDPDTGAKIEAKKWKDAWKIGLLEGLIVFPLSWLLTALTNLFGGVGAAPLFAIFITVIVIRLFMLVLNFKGQLGTIKMQQIQPEISKLSERLKDPTLTQSEKQALSMKMMDIYQKNDIHPFSSMISQFISFPIFIAVWAAMNQTLAIRKGDLLGMEFGISINTQIFSGNVTSIVLFALMIAGQICTMKLSNWLRIAKEKKKNPHYVKPKKNENEKQMNIMMTVMIALVVTSGFVLPAALVLYWFFGSLFSILQTVLFSTEFMNNKLKGLANRKKKAKVVR